MLFSLSPNIQFLRPYPDVPKPTVRYVSCGSWILRCRYEHILPIMRHPCKVLNRLSLVLLGSALFLVKILTWSQINRNFSIPTTTTCDLILLVTTYRLFLIWSTLFFHHFWLKLRDSHFSGSLLPEPSIIHFSWIWPLLGLKALISAALNRMQEVWEKNVGNSSTFNSTYQTSTNKPPHLALHSYWDRNAPKSLYPSSTSSSKC